MKTRTALQVLQFALNRDCGRENQKTINTQLIRNPSNSFDQISHKIPGKRNQAYNQITQPRIPVRNSQRNTNITNLCRWCGIQFTPEHLLICPAKKAQCNLCKKNRTLQQSMPISKNHAANTTNKTPTKYNPTKHPTNPTSTQHKNNDTRPTAPTP